MSKDHGHKTKQCKCGAIFSKAKDQSYKRWGETLICPKCRGRDRPRPQPINKVSHVIHPAIDAFLRGRTT